MVLDIVVYVLIGFGLFFNLMGSIGLHRFPDIYTRTHAATKCTTFGSILLILAVIIQSISTWVLQGDASLHYVLSIHSFFALICLLVTNPTSAHAIARAAYKRGIKPYRAVVDDLEGKEHD